MRALQEATRLKIAGRDVEAELWQASGWDRPREAYLAPKVIESEAQKLGVPSYELAVEKNVQVGLKVRGLPTSFAWGPLILKGICCIFFAPAAYPRSAICRAGRAL
jgi:hypothetical protein